MKLHLVLEDMIPGEQREQLFRHVDIHGITANSSEVRKNDVFVAIPGCQRDGHDFIHDAIKAGAAVVVGEKDIGELGVPYIKVPNSRLALGKMAGKFYEKPSNKHKIIGVTGTNGKTTTSFMLKQILEDAGLSCSLIGTVLNEINGQVMPSTHTTPDALKLHKLIFDSKDDVIIIEVSSHGLSQHRVEGVQFDCCLFTNLDHEHLDYHRDMEDYFSVKASLFDKLNQDGKAVVNGYNSWGEKLIKLLKHKQNSMFILGDSDGYDLRIGQGGRTGTIML
ncbi:MAG TPA: Mur ligase family protein, partial [Chondromyces sp.]|nr:Mur ligase family protein [Chondromyces sp.]